MVIKRVVCLANSRKLSGRCVAGKELVNGRAAGWVRPVSDRESEEVSEYERQYEDGSDPRVLDVIDVPLIEPRPRDYQRENWLLDPNVYWRKVGAASWRELSAYVDPSDRLWSDGHSTYHGLNDQIPLAEAATLNSSLRLIHVSGLRIAVFAPGANFGNTKRRVQGTFEHAGMEYRLWVTDPVYETTYKAKPDGEYEVGECYLTISLGEPYKGFCYKLIATIIEPDGGPRR